ncbi:cadherin-like domain-containing protein [Candidatus Woesearchaeota archaeon]|nr:cadherin-like domain-containing protein [Candidatus Woesearchaeota archaeon]
MTKTDQLVSSTIIDLKEEDPRLWIPLNMVAVVLCTMLLINSNNLLTGLVVQEKTYSFPVNLTVNETRLYTIKLAHAPASLKFSGVAVGNGTIKLYAQKQDANYLILDSSVIQQGGIVSITGLAVLDDGSITVDNTTGVTPSSPEPVTPRAAPDRSGYETPPIDLNLQYQSGTAFDPNDDGKETSNGVIDFTVASTHFSTSVNKDKLCTKWEVYSKENEKTTSVCYGADACCAFVDLTPTLSAWDAPFELNLGSYGATVHNTVSAKVLHIDYSLTGKTYENNSFSSYASLPADFSVPPARKISFEPLCVQTCNLAFDNETIVLYAIVDGVTLNLTSVVYTTKMVNRPPRFIDEIPPQEARSGHPMTFNISAYASDPDADGLSFSAGLADNASVEIHGNVATITPDAGYEGVLELQFTASDGQTATTSGAVLVNVSQQIVPLNEPVQVHAEIGKPVTWVKRVKVNKQKYQENISIDLPLQAMNVSNITKINNGQETAVAFGNVAINDNGTLTSLQNFSTVRTEEHDQKIEEIKTSLEQKFDQQDQASATKNQGSVLTGAVILDQPSPDASSPSSAPSLVVEDTSLDSQFEYEVEYSTESPVAVEHNVTDYQKQITISSDVNYTDILTYMDIPETPNGTVQLFWYVNDSKVFFNDVDYQDTNNDSLIDRLEWLTPHLSNQTFEAVITVLNVQSYPVVGGTWTTRFNATGTANLTIIGVNGTTYTEMYDDNASTDDDLALLSLTCGNTTLYNKSTNYTASNVCFKVADGSCVALSQTFGKRLNVTSIFVENFTCDAIAQHTVQVLTTGTHIQNFIYGNQTAYAQNWASVNGSQANVTVWDETDRASIPIGASFVFFANYTNKTSLLSINGSGINCSYSQNSSGSFPAPVNMTFNATNAIYQLNRSFSGVGNFSYNITCIDWTGNYDNLSVLDNFTVSPLPTTNRFIIRSATGANIASVDNNGNLFLNSTVYSSATLSDAPHQFIVQNTSGTKLAVFNESGLYLLGILSSASTPSASGFSMQIQNSTLNLVAIVDNTGNLTLKGNAYQNYTSP